MKRLILVGLMALIFIIPACSTTQREMVLKAGATYGTVKILKQMKASPEKADKIAEIAQLALSGDKDKIKEALTKVVEKEFTEEEQIIILSFLDDISKSLADLANTDAEIVVLIRVTAEGVIVGVEIYKRSLSGNLIPIYVV